MNYNDIRTLKDDDFLLVKTSLLLYMYSYYEEENLLDDNLKSLFENIINTVKYNNSIFDPPYFKMQVKYIKMIFKNAPTGIYTNISFKEDTKVKRK